MPKQRKKKTLIWHRNRLSKPCFFCLFGKAFVWYTKLTRLKLSEEREREQKHTRFDCFKYLHFQNEARGKTQMYDPHSCASCLCKFFGDFSPFFPPLGISIFVVSLIAANCHFGILFTAPELYLANVV